MLFIDTLYGCTLKGVIRIYQLKAIDTNSYFSAAYQYNDKYAASIVDFIAKKLLLYLKLYQ